MAKNSELKQWLCLDNICPQHDTRVIKGEVMDKTDHSAWLAVVDQIVPAGSFIRAGSIIEKPESAVKALLKEGVFAPVGTSRHFNLEDIFAERVQFLGDKPENKITLAEVLRAHGVYTLEAVAANAKGTIPFTDKKKGGALIGVTDILTAYADAEQVNAWIAQAKELCEG